MRLNYVLKRFLAILILTMFAVTSNVYSAESAYTLRPPLQFTVNSAIDALGQRLGRSFNADEQEEILAAGRTILQMLPAGTEIKSIQDIISRIRETNIGNQDRATLIAQGLKVPPTFVFSGKDLHPDYEISNTKFIAITLDEDFVAVNAISSITGDDRDVLAKGGVRWYQAGVDNLKTLTLEDKLTGTGITPLLAEAVGLGFAMWQKNATSNWFDGGKTDIVARNGADKVDVLRRWVRSSISAGVLLSRYIAGPDMGTGDADIMSAVVDEADSTQGILKYADRYPENMGGRGAILATTSRSPAQGAFPHAEWTVTSLTVVETMLVALSDAQLLNEMAIGEDDTITIAIQGFGDVGSGVIAVLDDLSRLPDSPYKQLLSRIKIVGVSDISGTIYNEAGLDVKELMRLREELLYSLSEEGKLEGKKAPEVVTDYKGNADRLSGREHGTDVLFKGATVVIPAAIPNVIKNAGQIGSGTKLIVEGANNSMAKGVELALYNDRHILVFSGPIANMGGIRTSTAEVEATMQHGEQEVLKDMDTWKSRMQSDLRSAAQANAKWLIDQHNKTGNSITAIYADAVKKIHAKRAELLQNPIPAMSELVESYRTQNLPLRIARLKAATELAKNEVMGLANEPAILAVRGAALTALLEDLIPGAVAQPGFITAKHHVKITKFLEEAFRDGKAIEDRGLEAMLTTADKVLPGAQMAKIKVFIIPGFAKATGVAGHWGVERGSIYLDEEYFGKWGNALALHEADELIYVIEEANKRDIVDLGKIAKWLDNIRADRLEILGILLLSHQKAAALPEGAGTGVKYVEGMAKDIQAVLDDIAKVKRELAKYQVNVDSVGAPIDANDDYALSAISNINVMNLDKQLTGLRGKLEQLLGRDPAVRGALAATVSRKEQVDSMNQIIAIPASAVMADNQGFEAWLAESSKDIAVVVIAMDDNEYDAVKKYEEAVFIKRLGTDISSEQAVELRGLMAIYGSAEFFSGFKLGSISDPKYKDLASQIAQGV